MLKVSRLIAEVYERHGIRMEPDDVGFALITLNQLMLEELARQLREGVRSGIAEFNEVVQKTETRAGKNLAQYVKAAAARFGRSCSGTSRTLAFVLRRSLMRSIVSIAAPQSSSG